MTDTTETEPAGSATRIRRADHAGVAFDADIADCRRIVGERGGLHYVAHFTSGIFDFALESPGLRAASRDMTESFERLGRHLSLIVAQADTVCEPLDSGPLIRVVVQGGSGALFHLVKVTGQSFFGLTLDGAPGTVDRADEQLGQLGESAAHRVGATSLNWGAFHAREDSGELWRTYQTDPSARPGCEPHTAGRAGLEVPGPVALECCRALHADDLHYIGIYRDGQLAWHTDMFEDPALASFFQRVTPAVRRRGYARLIEHVHGQHRRLTQLLDVTGSDRLVQLVLDVARGAIFVLPLNDDDYLVGVTLIQSQVKQADRMITSVREQLRPLAGAEGTAASADLGAQSGGDPVG